MIEIPVAHQPILLMKGITKRFGAHPALDGVDLALDQGRIHALVGENGAGKSTLVKIMTGAYRRDAGSIRLDGKTVDFRSPQEAQARGVVAVYQEVNLLTHRTVAENLFLGREPGRWGWIHWRRLRAEAGALLDRLGLRIDAAATLGTLSIALQQMVAIARGVSLDARVLILDEPTSSLSEREVATLFELIRQLRDAGTALVYISHRFEELYTICDDVTVLRDGRLVTTRPLAGLERVDLVALMLGKQREAVERSATDLRRPPTAPDKSPLIEARDLWRQPRLRGVSLTVRAGEIVGIAGLLGSGRTETARLLFGVDRAERGVVRWCGQTLTLSSPRDAIAAGIAFLSEDRKAEGIIPDLSVRENLTLAALPRLSWLGIVSRARQRELVERFITRLRIKSTSAEQPIRELSGGNQQKVLLARWLCRNPQLLILDDPTRGIDVGARAEIQALISEMAANGLAVLLISSELQELLEGCARLVVLHEGRSVGELIGDEIGEVPVMRAMAGDAAESSNLRGKADG